MPSLPSPTDHRLFDGAMGTELLAAGLRLGEPAEGWVLERPELIESIHRAYVQAGARVLTTASFGASRPNLARHGLDDRTAEINRRAVQLARRAATEGVLVAGNLGPLVRETTSRLDGEMTEAAFHEQGQALATEGVDLFLIETMTDPEEARLAVHALAALDRPIIASLTVAAHDGDGVRLLGGAPLAEAVHAVTSAGASAIGLNCMLTPGEMLGPVAALVSLTGLPVVVQPNAGQPKPRADGGFDYGETPEHFAAGIGRLLEAGATWVGGCCGTTPAHIAAIRFPRDSKPC